MESLSMIDPKSIAIPAYHRKAKPWLVEQLKQGMSANGYNVAYPIVVNGDAVTLVDGQHRILAAIAAGVTAIPYIHKPEGISPIRFGLQCNADGQLTAADDVFDLAELCWNLAQMGWEGKQIKEELGWDSEAKVTYYGNIKRLLHERAWNAARLTKISTAVNSDDDQSVNFQLTTVNWNERQFRSFLSELPLGKTNRRATMRAQVAAIQELLTKDKLTAKVAGEVARRYAWHMSLAVQMTNELAGEVGISDRKTLLKHIRNNVYGKEHAEAGARRFADTLAALNERATGIKLYRNDALQQIPTLEDGSIALVVTDPPYNVTGYEWDQFGTEGQYIDWLQEWLRLLRPKLAEAHHVFIFCDPDYAAPIEMMMRSNGWPIKSRIIWEYRNLVQGRDVTDRFISNWQMCLHTGSHALNWPPKWDDSRFEVQQHATPQSNFKEGKLHPSQKPLDLIRHLVEVGSKPGDLVLDPFAGSGTTGQACNEVKQRRCILIEQSDDYCTVIERRFGIQRVAL